MKRREGNKKVLKIRCFIGVLIPESVRDGIVSLQKSIELLPCSCKMVERENLHICLSFLGDVSEDEVGLVLKNLEEICSNHNNFEVEAEKIKLIPNESYVRVIALDVSNKSSTLEKISSEIKEKIGGSVKPPHITLCRVKRVSEKKKFLDSIVNLRPATGLKFIVDSIDLIKSKLSPRGPTYIAIKKIELSLESGPM